MNDPNSPSLSEPPPQPAAQAHSAAQLHAHPLWAQAAGRGGGDMGPPAARGRGGGRGRGRGAAQQQQPEEEGTTRYERISLLAAELQGCATGGDGADSALFSEDGDGESDADESRRPGHADEDEDDGDSYEDPAEAEARDADGMSALESSDDDEGRAPQRSAKRQKKKKEKQRGSASGPVSASEMMAAAAFGGRSRMFGDATSDDESQISRTSSKRKRDAYCQAFPVKGVTCVGCALANRIGPVERFVMQNVGRQAEHALWKFASLTWKKEVVEPARREGVHVVDWPWRDIANHFRLHTTSAVVGRTAMINTLTAMRCQVESVLVRNDNGERTLDKGNAELALKILAAESRERQLLQADRPGGRGRGSGSAQKPAGGDE